MKNFQQHKQDLFEGHSDPLQQIRLPGVSSTDEELGRPAPQEQGGEEGEGSHRAEGPTWLGPPGPTAELALCIGGTRIRVSQADIIQKLLCPVTIE